MATGSDVAKFQYSADGSDWSDFNAVGEASISSSRPALDITPLGVSTSQFITGIQSVTASCAFFFDIDDATHKQIADDANSPPANTRYYRLLLETGEGVSGLAHVTGYDITSRVGDVVRATFNLQFTGTVTILHTS